MSAIWGILQKDGKPVSEDLKEAVIKRLGIYKVDSIDAWEKGSIHFGCGIQYITPESLHEMLPYYDAEKGLAITADAIIDNREELFKLLGIRDEHQSRITDSELILLSYEKWGVDCPRHLVGDFSFAIWNERKEELFCARDHVGKRTFYYYNDDRVFAFCTVIRPIFDMIKRKPGLNEKWITDFLALKGVVHGIEYGESPYERIYQLKPAHTFLIKAGGISERKYWDPLKEVKPLRLNSDAEYVEEFRKVFFKAVHCRLRSISDVGIMLSGGLDSGSIACIAAEKLANDDKRLKAFSSVPMEGYKDEKIGGFIADESEYIQTIVDKYSNIDIEFCRNEGRSSVSDISEYIDILEQPYKTIENSFWVLGITRRAAQKGCKVLLTGQSGNTTISLGDFDMHVKTLFGKGRLLSIKREVRGLSRLHSIPEERIWKEVLRVVLPYSLRKIASSLMGNSRNWYETSPVNPELAKKWKVKKRLTKKGYNLHPEKFYNLKNAHKLIVNNVGFSQVAVSETKASLVHGIVNRDPSRDKRVIEFILSLPSDQLVRDGVERRLIREAMKGILPDKVRCNHSKRGLQAADWILRLKPSWKEIFAEIEQALSNSSIRHYIDADKLMKELDAFREGPDEKNRRTLRTLLIILVFSRFIDKHCSMKI